MSREWKDKAGRVKRAKTFRQIRAGLARAKLWRERWEKYPDSMRANLDKLNAKTKQVAQERTKRLELFVSKLPRQMMTGELRAEMAKVLAAFGQPAGKRDVERVLSALRRRGMVAFDNVTLQWSVAMPSQ